MEAISPGYLHYMDYHNCLQAQYLQKETFKNRILGVWKDLKNFG